ncbi:MAG: hypothetical protein H6840_12530 [Planctomycetes bacterium]|nr:hypothetical protein [Planctomycetota bacterium]
MATQQEVVLRPGDSISVRLEVPGQPLRLDLSLTPEGVAMSQPMPMGAPTIFGGVRPPEVDELEDDSEALDLTAEFAAEDSVTEEPPPVQRVESLAAVEPFGDMPQAVDIPFEDVADDTSGYGEPATQEVTESDDLDLDLNDLGEEEVTVGVDIPADDPGVDIPTDDAVDIPLDDEPGFSADARTMVPPTRQAPQNAMSLSLDDDEPAMALDNLSLDSENEEYELDADGNPKKKFKPGPEDTLPVWTGKASTYRDPELEKKKETSKLNKSGAPAKGAAPAAKPLAKKPVTKPVNKPITGGVSPAASKKAAPAAAAAGGGNFTVFLSPPKGAEKKQAAAEIIADIQGIDMNSALALAGKMIVPVVKGVSENEAGVIRDRFKDAGLSCRITQKR